MRGTITSRAYAGRVRTSVTSKQSDGARARIGALLRLDYALFWLAGVAADGFG